MASLVETQTHCPANKAADIIGDRWTLQIVRAMMLGATRYSDLQQAVPRISPTVLSARLKQLAENGIIVRRESTGSKSATYRLTPSGRELRPIIMYLATWGLKWASRNIKESNVNIGALMWDLHKTLRTCELPDGETVLSITLSDVEQFSKWWIVANGRNVDLCTDPPGKDVDVYLTCPLSVLIGIWQGEESIREKIAEGLLVIDGPTDLVQTVDDWFPLSPVAAAQSPDSRAIEASD